jgi:NADH-quinone oxidoreductase subunit J
MLLNYFTYLLGLSIIFTGLALIVSKNPVQSVLLLVLVFIQTALLFFLVGAEFLGILLITVYVGAIAILFLFVVMLLNLRIVELYSTMQYHVPVGAFVGVLFAVILTGVCYHDFRHLALNSFYEREELFP